VPEREYKRLRRIQREINFGARTEDWENFFLRMFSARLVRASSRNYLQAGHSVTARLLTAYTRPLHAAHSTRYLGATGGPGHNFVRFKSAADAVVCLVFGGWGEWVQLAKILPLQTSTFKHFESEHKFTILLTQMEGKFILQRSWHEEGVWEDGSYCCIRLNSVENWDSDGVHYQVIVYLWCEAVQCAMNLRTFRRKFPPPSSGWKSSFP